METINIQQIKKKIEKKIENHFMETFVQIPDMDEEKLSLLSMMVYHDTQLTEVQKERYMITTMLVQIALDTHERVAVRNHFDDNETVGLTNQLRVLAGDYYSGLYYFLLSEIEDIDYIHSLATAIKEINEYKMQLYYQEIHSFDDYMMVIQKIESLLFVYVSNHLNKTELNQTIELSLLITKLKKESKKINAQQKSALIDNWLSFNHTGTNRRATVNAFYSMVQNKKAELEESIFHLPAKYTALKTFIRSTLNEDLYYHNQVAKER